MQSLVVLFAIFVLSFVAGMGWYAGRGVAEFAARFIARGEAKPSTKRAELPAQNDEKSVRFFE